MTTIMKAVKQAALMGNAWAFMGSWQTCCSFTSHSMSGQHAAWSSCSIHVVLAACDVSQTTCTNCSVRTTTHWSVYSDWIPPGICCKLQEESCTGVYNSGMCNRLPHWQLGGNWSLAITLLVENWNNCHKCAVYHWISQWVVYCTAY